MSIGAATLLYLLNADQELDVLNRLPADDLAFVYVHSAYLAAVTEYLGEQHWLQGDLQFLRQIHQSREFAKVSFLHPTLSKLEHKDLKPLKKRARQIEARSIEMAKTRRSDQKRQFAHAALACMTRFFLHEEVLQDRSSSQNPHIGPRLYRCFDRMDEFLGLDYKADIGMKTDFTTGERLYEGAGIGVQSGYSTVLLALHHLGNAKHIVDLGSGYGRVGLIAGLLRPDVQFTGYEYVDHRVRISNQIAAEFNIQSKVQFFTQDLSDRHFRIPAADVYYLYDPFSAETYQYVLQQLVQLSHKQAVTIVTKGNARGWLMGIAKTEGWPAPTQIDAGNLCLFESGNNKLTLADADQPFVHLL